jgi:hypothetical protein
MISYFNQEVDFHRFSLSAVDDVMSYEFKTSSTCLVIDVNVHDVKLLPCYPLGICHECWLLIRKETFEKNFVT